MDGHYLYVSNVAIIVNFVTIFVYYNLIVILYFSQRFYFLRAYQYWISFKMFNFEVRQKNIFYLG
jgi:hypothetical protein